MNLKPAEHLQILTDLVDAGLLCDCPTELKEFECVYTQETLYKNAITHNGGCKAGPIVTEMLNFKIKDKT